MAEATYRERDSFDLVLKAVVRSVGRGGGQPVPNHLRQKMESAFGADFSAVRVHVGRGVGALGARAFTHGSDIFFAPGWYNLHTTWGQQLLGHELTHVLQQRSGCVENPWGFGIAVVEDEALEAEAERMGWYAVAHAVDSGATMARDLPRPPRQAPGSWVGRPERGPSAGSSVVQCAFGKDLFGKTLVYFQGQGTGMTYVEFNKLNNEKETYDTIDQVKEGLKKLRSAKGTEIQVPSLANESKVEARPLAIPESWKRSFGPFQVFRATDDSPGKIKWQGHWVPLEKNPERFLKGAIQELLADPRVYAQEHVSANKKYVNSFSPDWTCCGYWNTRKYVYRVNVPAMYMFVPPDVLDSQGKPSKTMRPPIIWADVSDRTLKDAKKIAFDPRKDQPEKGPEVDLIFTVTLDLIDRYMDTKTNKWVDLDAQFWKNVKAEAP